MADLHIQIHSIFIHIHTKNLTNMLYNDTNGKPNDSTSSTTASSVVHDKHAQALQSERRAAEDIHYLGYQLNLPLLYQAWMHDAHDDPKHDYLFMQRMSHYTHTQEETKWRQLSQDRDYPRIYRRYTMLNDARYFCSEAGIQMLKDQGMYETILNRLTTDAQEPIDQLTNSVRWQKRKEICDKDELASLNRFVGKHVVITGELNDVDRVAVEKLIESCRGHAKQSVTNKTDYLIVGHRLPDGRDVTESTKYQKMLALNTKHIMKSDAIHVLTEPMLRSMVSASLWEQARMQTEARQVQEASATLCSLSKDTRHANPVPKVKPENATPLRRKRRAVQPPVTTEHMPKRVTRSMSRRRDSRK